MRTVVLMMTDVVGSTRLWAQDHDAMIAAMARHHHLVHALVVAHGGSRPVDQGEGDSVFAAFPSASAAVTCAAEVQRRLGAEHWPTPSPLRVRVALHVGEVEERDGNLFGTAVNRCARLRALAAGGQTLVSSPLYELLRDRLPSELGLQDLGEHHLKDLPRPERVWQLTGPGLDGPFPPLNASSAPEQGAVRHHPPVPPLLVGADDSALAGRAEELAAASSWWTSALSGQRHVVLLAGEPGIGKTRLAREVALDAHERGAVVLYGRCEEELGAPYQPFVEALDFYLEHVPAARLVPLLGRHPGELVRLHPAVGRLVPGLDAPLASDAETERHRLFQSIASWLCAAAEPAGLVLVLDDLHWATKPTLLLLQHVLHATSAAKLLVVGTYRDTDLAPDHFLAGLLADLRRTGGVSRLALSGLEVDAVADLVASLASEPGRRVQDADAGLARALHVETAGNPFFLGEILRHMSDTGTPFVPRPSRAPERGTPVMGVPAGIREVVDRRLRRLSADVTTALTAAAVAGRDFDLTVVATACGLDEEAVVEALEEAVRARLVEETAVGQYRFAHALVRASLYDALSATRRSRMHSRIARATETSRPQDTIALARHFLQGRDDGDWEKALEYLIRAGDEAMQKLAHDDAIDAYGQALALVEQAPDHGLLRCRLMVALGKAQRYSGEAAHRETLLAAAAHAQQVGSAALLTQAALANTRGFWSTAGHVDDGRIAVLEEALATVGDEDSADRARLMAMLGTELMFTSGQERRVALSDEATQVARRVADPSALLDVLMSAAPANYTPWRMPVLLKDCDELLTLAERVGDPQRTYRATVWNFLARIMSGDVEKADACLRQATRLVDDLGQPTVRWLLMSYTCLRTLLAGELDEAEVQLADAYELGQRTGQPDAFTWYAGQLWVLLRERGQLLSLFDTVHAQVQQNPGLPAWQTVLALMHCLRGERDEAAAILSQLTRGGRLQVERNIMWLCVPANLLEVAEAVDDARAAAVLYAELRDYRHLPVHGGTSYLGSCERYLAAGARAAADLDLAVSHLEAAVVFEERMGAKTWLGVTYGDLARTLRLRDHPGDAASADGLVARALDLARVTGSAHVEARACGRLG